MPSVYLTANVFLSPETVDTMHTGAPTGSVPQNICSSGTFLLGGKCGRNNSPWKESVAQDLNCAL